MYKTRPTKEALILKTALEKLGISVREEVSDGHKHIDLSIPDSFMDIEIDGPKHFTDPYQILRDFKRTYYSSQDGYDTIHIPNELINKELGAIASAIAEAAKIREEQVQNAKK